MTKFQSPVDNSWVTDGHKDGSALDLGWLSKLNNKHQNIYAIGNGTVLSNTYYSDSGNMVVIAHDYNATHDMWTGYAHLQNKGIVDVGQKVKQGDKIGNMGATGVSRGEHLHVRMALVPKGTKYLLSTYNRYKRLDPAKYLYEYPHQNVDGLPKLPKEESKPKPTQTGIKKGDTVQVKASAKKYANVNVTIPAFVKRNKYQVLEVQGNMARLSSINSWVKLSDLTVNGKDVKPVPKPQPSKPKKEYVSVGGRHTLYKASTGIGHYGATNQNLAHRRMEVLERKNGRVRVNAKPFMTRGKRTFDVDSFWVKL